MRAVGRRRQVKQKECGRVRSIAERKREMKMRTNDGKEEEEGAAAPLYIRAK